MIRNKKILISGAGGFIGINLAKYFAGKGNHILGLLMFGQKNKFLTDSIICDITSMKSLKNLKNYEFDYVFHLAGLTDVKRSIENPIECFNVNINGTLNLLEFLRNKKIISFNLISSVGVLSKSNSLPISEKALYGPTTPYAASKMSAESILQAYGDCYNLPFHITRLFNVYGPGKYGLVIYDFIKKLILNQNVLEIHGDGEQIRDFLFIDDVVKGIELVSHKGLNKNIYHLASGKPISINKLAFRIIKYIGLKNVKITHTNTHFNGELTRWYGDNTKLKKIGFKPTTSLKTGLIKTIDWFKTNKK